MSATNHRRAMAAFPRSTYLLLSTGESLASLKGTVMRHMCRDLALASAVFAASLGVGTPTVSGDGEPRSTIAFVSTRGEPDDTRPAANWEIWLMDGDGTNPRRLTVNTTEGFAEFMPSLSPDGRGKIVFDSNRVRVQGEPLNTSGLFLMNHDGTEETFLTRGSSATWSPVGPNGNASKNIAFHRSASFTVPPVVGVQRPIRQDPGAPAFDSDIFVVNVDDLLENGEQPRNITNTALYIEDDASWSPDGEKIAFTRHPRSDNQNNSIQAEICVMDADGNEEPVCILGGNGEEERGPAWSPDGTRFVYICRKGAPAMPGGAIPSFEICVINADGTGELRLTENNVFDGTPQWSPDGQTILFSRGTPTAAHELWLMNPDGTGQEQFTDTVGFNSFSNWGAIAVGGGGGPQ
jgi:TolB protein